MKRIIDGHTINIYPIHEEILNGFFVAKEGFEGTDKTTRAYTKKQCSDNIFQFMREENAQRIYVEKNNGEVEFTYDSLKGCTSLLYNILIAKPATAISFINCYPNKKLINMLFISLAQTDTVIMWDNKELTKDTLYNMKENLRQYSEDMKRVEQTREFYDMLTKFENAKRFFHECKGDFPTFQQRIEHIANENKVSDIIGEPTPKNLCIAYEHLQFIIQNNLQDFAEPKTYRIDGNGTIEKWVDMQDRMIIEIDPNYITRTGYRRRL